MQESGHRVLSYRRQKEEDFGIGHGLPSNPDFSRSSNCSALSISLDENKIHGTNSFRAAAREVAGTLIPCFLPRRCKSVKKADWKGSTIQHCDVSSASSSKISTTNNGSISNFRHGSFHSRNEAQQETTMLSIADIYKSTANFSVENRMGLGGFGAVYKGKLKDGSLVASIYNRNLSAEFKSEVQIMSKVEHLNLVRFFGFLEHDDERLLVVEYVGNGTLREHLDGSRGDGLELEHRLNIATDVAHAITYLHTYTDHPIIHRDIKASNILLTEKLRAKVADFGFARLAPDDPDATHISTQIKGTAGYVDPEYLRTYQLTDKSDVYSFGVLLVELVTGRRPIECNRDRKERITTKWVTPSSMKHLYKEHPYLFSRLLLTIDDLDGQAIRRFKEGDSVLAMDPRLRRSQAAIAAVEKVMGLALQCMAPSRRSRPDMKRCAEVLWAIRREYREMLSPLAVTRRSKNQPRAG
ncbi:Calmodulin-binding receptor-like cytoplasmic kinase 2 [Cocos nucifera]|uniref:Calmodulin-binding receptor-like cytoplasmic kinase 2 n=1 Tax=Cocos nucifera TaxID=13894 RepID=A0A8K0IYY5_COCNU|nr:Calmodulin-binding receptor-like cytoplasmic kinase 2 [Cocos nucifera]